MKKELKISIPILIVIIISVIVTTIIMNNKEPVIDPNLTQEASQQNDNEENPMNEIFVNLNGQKLKINLEDNSTTSALIKLLPLSLSMNDLNDNEKYVYLDESLPTNTFSPKHIESGDVMLYGDNCLVIFYKSFSTNYDYTKIGHIDDLPNLGDGEVPISMSTE